jgi:hypothetical protein
MKYLFEFKEYLNKNFWVWFENSKVVDKKGNPLIVYHGSSVNKLFNKFNENSPIWFSTYKGYADAFTDYKGKLFSVYLKLENPIYVGFIDGIANDNSIKHLSELTNIDFDTLKEILKKSNGVNLFKITNSLEFKELVQEMGYDGIEAKEGGGLTSFAVFSSKQIKSATNNNGNFDLKSQNINENTNKKLQNINQNMKHLKIFEGFNYDKSRYVEILNKINSAKVGDILPEDIVYQYVEYLVVSGSLTQDYGSSFVDGDLGERIEKYPSYKLMELPIGEIDLDEFELDEEIADEYAEKFEKTKYYPPLVVGAKNPKFGTYRIIDGNHRGNGLKIAGEEFVLAFVGIKN